MSVMDNYYLRAEKESELMLPGVNDMFKMHDMFGQTCPFYWITFDKCPKIEVIVPEVFLTRA